jgi:two-component system response regulator AtoC
VSSVLLVDDEPGVLYMMKEVLEARGHDVIAVRSGAEALRQIEHARVVVSDLAMPEMDGLALLAAVRERRPGTPFVIVTAHGNERVAVNAMKLGAHDYLTKPVDIDELRLVVERAIGEAALRTEVRRMRAEQSIGRRIVAESPAMRRLLESIDRVADKDLTVLVRGETGTGKELVAALVHAHSKRSDKPFVRFNCAALTPELAEAELFGHAKGAFTGATSTRRGFFAEADGGTLLLDEIGELPLALQPKLLRALQEGEIQPVGGRIAKVDVRVVASTHRDLASEVKGGRFREDLYYRLAVIELLVPPLRERRVEIPALAEELARQWGRRFDMPSVELSDELLAALARAEWPGNVRELENAIARMVALSGSKLTLEAYLAPGARPPDVEPAEETAEETAEVDATPLRAQVEAFERGLVVRVLAECNGNQTHAARRLGIARATLIDKLKRYGIR